MNLKPYGKKLQASSYVKYLSLYLDEYLDLSPRFNDRIIFLQKKVMHIISFACCDGHVLPIFAKLNIMKFSNLISLCHCLFIHKKICSKSLSVFSYVFILASNTHEQNTRFASYGLLAKPTCNTSKYGTNDFAASAVAL